MGVHELLGKARDQWTALRSHPWIGRVATQISVAALLVGALWVFVGRTASHQPLGQWLFWRYAGYWLGCAIWGLGCLSAGDALVSRLLPGRLPLRERLATSFATGVVLYYLIASATGLLFVYGRLFFFAVPAVMIAVGAPGLFRLGRRAFRHLGRAKRTGRPAPFGSWLLVGFGVLGLALVYFLILTPENVQFDSRWKHFALAEQYAVTGGIRRFPEGWTVATNPHLATFVYLWGFLLPFGQLFDRVELAAHLEFFIFVVTTLSIGPLARRLVPGCQARHLWAARFLFPGTLLYDSTVSGGADHIAALFTVPMFLLALRGFRDLSWRHSSLFALMVAGAAMSKLTCLLMFIPVAAVVYGGRSLWLLARPPAYLPGARRQALIGPAVALGVALVATSTFWLKNWVFYGDPIYPSLFRHLGLRPWHPDSADLFVWGYQDYQFWRPDRSWAGLEETLHSLWEFSFVPHDYPKYHGKVPVFGSLFTLTVPALLLLRKTTRIWGLVASVHVALFVWYWVHHQDRYLQALVPWMAATTAATLYLVWKSGWLPRAAAVVLVGYQIVWGGDVYFIPTHAMCRSAIKESVDLLAGTYQKAPKRLEAFSSWRRIGEKIPRGARVLLHDNHVHLGLGHQTVSDWGAWQFGISYARHPEPTDTWALLRSMGVTHLVWTGQKSQGWDSIAGDLVFFNFALRHTEKRTRVGSTEIALLGAEAPSEPGVRRVLYLGCDKLLKDGLYELGDLHVPVFGPRSAEFPPPRETGDEEELGRAADAVVLESRCHRDLPSALRGRFELVARRKALRHFRSARELLLYVTRSGRAPADVAEPAPKGNDSDFDPTLGIEDEPAQ